MSENRVHSPGTVYELPGPHISEHFGCRIEFRFPTVKVLDYKAEWEGLERSENPFAVVIMAHLKAQELDLGEGEERKRWKLRLIRLLYERGFDPGGHGSAPEMHSVRRCECAEQSYYFVKWLDEPVR